MGDFSQRGLVREVLEDGGQEVEGLPPPWYGRATWRLGDLKGRPTEELKGQRCAERGGAGVGQGRAGQGRAGRVGAELPLAVEQPQCLVQPSVVALGATAGDGQLLPKGAAPHRARLARRDAPLPLTVR